MELHGQSSGLVLATSALLSGNNSFKQFILNVSLHLQVKEVQKMQLYAVNYCEEIKKFAFLSYITKPVCVKNRSKLE